jgi:arylsulfatase A-like enzyme
MLGDHYMWGKEGYFDQAYHIPLLIRDPRRAADNGRGTVVAAFTEAVDLMPTILEWLGLPVPAQCDGQSLVPFLEGQSPAGWRQEAHWEYDFRDPVRRRVEEALGLADEQCGIAVLRGDRYKYVHFTALPPLLFDLEADPAELVNRAEDPALREVRLACAERMLSWRMNHAERTQTSRFITEQGVIERAGPRRLAGQARA